MRSEIKQTLLAVRSVHTETQALADFERERERVPERVGRNVLSIKMFEPDNKSTPGSCKL